MILAITSLLATSAFADCNRTDLEQKQFTDGLETLHNEVAAAQLDPNAKDPSKKAAKEMHAHHKKGELCTAEDRFWATMNLLQAREPEDAETAYTWAQQLMNEHHPRGPWLAGLAYDRMSISKGALQSYGTQTGVENGKRCLMWVDLQFSDEQRVKMGHPKLTETVASILQANGETGVKPTVLELKNRGLWCKPQPWDGSRSDLRDPYDGRK